MANTADKLTKLIFNRSGFGRYMSREETVEHLNPLIEQHMRLNLAYRDVTQRITRPSVAERLRGFRKVAEMDTGKLMEQVFSCGGTAYNGTALEPDDVHLGDSDDEMLFNLQDQEQALHDAFKEEAENNHHQIRSDAMLNLVVTNSEARLHFLKQQSRGKPRPSTRPHA